MRLRLATGLLVSVMAMLITGVADDVRACGDKFFRLDRMGGGKYMAAHPATILIYRPAGSAAARVPDLPKLLTNAGHRVVEVTATDQLSRVFAAGPIDLIVAGLADEPRLSSAATAAASRADLVPILIRPTSRELAQTAARYPCLIKAPTADENAALAEIDHRMHLRTRSATR